MQIVVADLSAVALDPAPIEPSWIIEGAPEARTKELARSADGTAVVVDWSCTAGQFHWHSSVDETLHVISGFGDRQGLEDRSRVGRWALGAGRAGVGEAGRYPEERAEPRLGLLFPDSNRVIRF
jgi:hypothetical protein